MTDYTFTASDDASKTVKRYNGVIEWKDRQNFFIDRIGAKSASVGVGVARRRSAEQILFTFKKYTAIDYSKSAQSIWKKVYESLVDQNGNPNPQKEETSDKKSTSSGRSGQAIYGR